MFYDVLLPALRKLGPAPADGILCLLGQLAMAIRPRHGRRLRQALLCARSALDADWSVKEIWPAVAANTARFLARDYPLDCLSDREVLGRFDVRGFDRLRATLADGRGAILVGSHLGAHIAGVHWLLRSGTPLRLLVQRPRHVSGELNRRFDAADIHSQEQMFLRRDLSPVVAVERMLQARAALLDGLAIYLNGDIPWSGPNTCAGIFLGHHRRFLAIWTKLAVLTNASVFLVFCTHLAGGRFALEIDGIGNLCAGEEEKAVADYLRQLEARIANYPAEAIAHLAWSCYQSRPSPSKAPKKSEFQRAIQGGSPEFPVPRIRNIEISCNHQ